MPTAKYLAVLLIFVYCGITSKAQNNIKGKIIDAITKEPVYGASIHCNDPGCTCGCITNAAGEFVISCKADCKKISISFIGYTTQSVTVDNLKEITTLNPSSSLMNEVVISANRGETIKRSQAPIAISQINSKTIQETKAITVDQLLNKISGVNMNNTK
jgi:hypothetical protein